MDTKCVYTVLTDWLRPRILDFVRQNQKDLDLKLAEGRWRFEAMVRNRYEQEQGTIKGRLGMGPSIEEVRNFLLSDDPSLGTSPYWTCFDRVGIDRARKNVEWGKQVLDRCGKCGLRHRVRVRHEELVYIGV